MNEAVGRFALNLFLLLAAGVGALYWIGYHTELLGVVGGLLGLGGVFAWVAFVLGLIHEDTKKRWQLAFESGLSRYAATLICALLLGALIGVGGLFGSVRIDASRDLSDRFVEIHPVGSSAPQTAAAPAPEAESEGVVAARTVRTFPLFVAWQRREYEISLDGLPSLEVSAGPWARRVVMSPHDLLARSFLLIRPTTRVSETARKSETVFELRVWIGGDAPRILPDYRGRTVWIGCDESVAIPSALRERWRLELFARKLPEAMMLSWLRPRALAETRALRQNERLRIEMAHPGQSPWIVKDDLIAHCGSPDCFPQEVILEAP